jgi:proteasome lid subunit RPN8/RPN11
MLNHRNGTKFEDLTFIDTVTGKHLTRDDYDVENEVIPSRRMRSMVTNNDPYTVIAVHNHPGSSVPSIADIESAYRHKYKYGVVACHNGTVMKYEVLGEYNEVIVGILLDKANKNLYNGSEEELTKTLEMLKAENILLGVFK